MQADGVRGPVGIRLGHVGRGEDPAGGAEAQPGPEVRIAVHIINPLVPEGVREREVRVLLF